MSIRLPLTVLLSVPLALALGACTPSATTGPGGTPGTGATPTTGETPAAAITCDTSGADQSVSVVDFAYEPATMTVTVGQSVEWSNEGQAAHTVTFEAGPDCGTINSGETVSATFGQAGSYEYVCTFHSNMRGTVQVNQ